MRVVKFFKEFGIGFEREFFVILSICKFLYLEIEFGMFFDNWLLERLMVRVNFSNLIFFGNCLLKRLDDKFKMLFKEG